jgi:valyl-tRNA synthetase
LILPFTGRQIKVIADSMVDMKFGTGAVKVTPAHDPNDYLLGIKHNLDFINVMYPDGRMNENAAGFKEMERLKAREAILEGLKGKELLGRIEPHQLSVGHCYRCHTIIEPYLSRQWFVKMKPLAKPAIEAVKKGRIKFYPRRWTKVYLNWMENIQDWCISRQIWWGHRLPVYYCKNCLRQASESTVDSRQSTEKIKSMDDGPWTMDSKGIIVSRVKPEKCPACGSTDLYQDEDVLDTWFSSWLWPFATFYWPSGDQGAERKMQCEEDLKYFYPTSVLVTAPEIIFFWVARMIMAGLEFMQDIPFKDVYIHGTVRDIEGRKMSKSLGNIIDPLDIIEHVGTDALRFSLISVTATGQDVFLSEEKFIIGRNFANKIWNASRLILMNLDSDRVHADLCAVFKKENLGMINRWILSRFYSTLKKLNTALEAYNFNEAANLLYQFFWHDFCDWYLELIKQDIKNPHNQIVLYKILEKSLRLLHPFMPFVTEELWQRLPHEGNSIMVQPWPHIEEDIIDKNIEHKMNIIFEIITAIRNARQELGLPVHQTINAIIATNNKTHRDLINSHSSHIKIISRLSGLEIKEKYVHIKSSVTSLIKDIHLSIPLEGIVDVEKEILKIKERINKIESEINIKGKNLNNKEFMKKAPREVIEKEEERLNELSDNLRRLKTIENDLRR